MYLKKNNLYIRKTTLKQNNKFACRNMFYMQQIFSFQNGGVKIFCPDFVFLNFLGTEDQ